MTLGFIQNIGPIEWLILLFMLVGGVAAVGFVLWIVLRATKPAAPSLLESRVTRLEQQVAAMQAVKP